MLRNSEANKLNEIVSFELWKTVSKEPCSPQTREQVRCLKAVFILAFSLTAPSGLSHAKEDFQAENMAVSTC